MTTTLSNASVQLKNLALNSTIHFRKATTSTPEQFIAGLTDFGPGRALGVATDRKLRSWYYQDIRFAYLRGERLFRECNERPD